MTEDGEYRCAWQGCGKLFEPSVAWQKYCCRAHRYRVRHENEVAAEQAVRGERPRVIPLGKGGARPATRKLRRYTHQVEMLDARTLEGRLERQTIRELTAHVGGNPSSPQKILIVRSARLLVMTEHMEKRLIEGGEASDWAGRQMLAWVNTLRRTLEALGLGRPQQQPAKLADVLRIKAS